jgi:hypothetical protein
VQFGTHLHGPAPALRQVHFVIAVPCPFDDRLAIPFVQAAIHLAVDLAEVKLATPLLIELERMWALFADRIRVVVGNPGSPTE